MNDDYITREEFELLADKIGGAAGKVDQLAALLSSTRPPSKAAQLSSGLRRMAAGQPYALDGYQPGAFLSAVAAARSHDHDEQAAGKARLEELSRYQAEDEVRTFSKATLGTTDATGGWIIPNAIVDEMTKVAQFRNPYRSLVTVVPGITAPSVDIPFRSTAPTRAVIAAWGTEKQNLDLAYNAYSASVWTLARIHDVSNQMLRKSAGAAERDVMSELAHAFALGEAYYIVNGAGTTEPYGLKTALTNAPATFTSSFSPSATTLAGSIAKAIATAAGALVARNRRPEAVVMSATAYAELLSQGTDSAGFFLSGISGPQSVPGFAPGTLVSPWGIPVIPDSQFAADDMIVGEWSALKLYLGQGYRVDSSDVAGTRFDYNLTGFRAEMEMALDARPAVYAGAFQLIEDILP